MYLKTLDKTEHKNMKLNQVINKRATKREVMFVLNHVTQIIKPHPCHDENLKKIQNIKRSQQKKPSSIGQEIVIDQGVFQVRRRIK